MREDIGRSCGGSLLSLGTCRLDSQRGRVAFRQLQSTVSFTFHVAKIINAYEVLGHAAY